MLYHKHKCIFVHVNKTGGATINRFLGGRPAHMSAKGYRKTYPNYFDDYFKFSFVRNPWDKLVSLYFMHTRLNWDLRWDWSAVTAPCFSDFLRITHGYNKTKQRHIYRGHPTGHMRMSNQLDWLVDENGSLIVDFVGRFENYQEDFNTVCDKIGIPQPQEIPHRNKSEHKHYTEYYDNETREIVATRFAKDIEYFGYEFGS